jgi:uncharacterized membrane protein
MTNTLDLVAERGMGGGFGHRGDGHFLMPLVGLALLLGAIGLVVWLVARRRPAMATASAGAPVAPMAAAPSPTFQAESILAERLARSEISPDDYRAMIAALRDQPPGA